MYLPLQSITTASFGMLTVSANGNDLSIADYQCALLRVVCPSFTMVALVNA